MLKIGPLIYNPLDCFPKEISLQKIVKRCLDILDEILPFDFERIEAWAFCLALRSAALDIEGFSHPNARTIEIAKILYDELRLSSGAS